MSRTVAALALVAITSFGTGALAFRGAAEAVDPGTTDSSEPRATEPATSTPPSLADVARRDLRKTFTADGVLSFGDPTGVVTNSTGIVHGLPEAGAVPEFGAPLFFVDDEPVFVFKGAVPQYRDFRSGMSSGKDILQLEYALRISSLVDNSTLEPNEKIGKATWSALDRLYGFFDLDGPDRLPVGSLLFVPDSFRISSVRVVNGQRLSGAETIFERTDVVPTVEVKIDPSRLALFPIGGAATVKLPTEEVLAATVVSHDSQVEGSFGNQNDAPADVAIGVELEFVDQVDFDLPELAPVEVAVTQELHRAVVSVPLVALVALAGGGFGVERWDGQQSTIVPVEIGATADGYVEITASDLRVGESVVVP